MKELLYTHVPGARTLAGIAHEMLLETRDAAASKVSDLRSQVDELWDAAGEVLPRARQHELIRRVESAVEALRNRDTIGFPAPGEA